MILTDDSVMSLAPTVTPPNFACNEHELVAAVRQGSDRAFEELYSRYRSRISAYVFGMVGDHGRAEDIAQEVFISALRRLRDTERPIAFKPWIYEIAKNACIDDFRRTRRTHEVPLEPEDGESELPSSGPTPDAAVESKQSLSDLKGAFHGLSENHHKVIVMRELEGLSYSQIGARLGMSRPVVGSTLFRARRRLSEEYDELVSGRRCEQVQTLIAADEPRSLMKLGVRERRQLARHLADCQLCRTEARMAGVDDSLFAAPKTLAGKIAALLPFPWLRWRRSHAGGSEEAAAAPGSHSWSAIQGIQKVARLVDPTGPATGFGRAAAAAAAIAVAGIGSGVVTGAVGSHGHGGSSAATGASAITPAAKQGAPSPGARFAGHGIATQRAAGGGGPAGTGSAGGTAGRTAGSTQANGSSPGSGSGSASTSTGQGGAGSTGGSGGITGAAGKVGGGGGRAGTPAPRLPSLPNVKLPAPQLPNLNNGLPLPKIPLPKLPTPQLPHVSVPKVPGVSVPDPNKLLGQLTHHL